LFASACSGNGKETLTGSTEEVLNAVLEASGELPAAATAPVTSENSQNALGISPSDFDKYVSEASVSTALIMTSAHEVALVKVKNAGDVATVKNLIASGFDSGKWICVAPGESLVVESGTYILLVASTTANADAIVAAFKTKAGDNVGEVNIFFTGR
jgi:hypothetical protein